MPNDKGIMFSRNMIQAIDENRKTQMRRLVNNPGRLNGLMLEGEAPEWCPYAVGQKLYLKEAHYRYGKWVKNGGTNLARRQAGTQKQAWRFVARKSGVLSDVFFDAGDVFTVRSNSYRKNGWYKRPPLFMPKKFARKWFVTTAVGCERVQDISEADAVAQGINADGCCRCPDDVAGGVRFCVHCNLALHDIVDEFRILWNSIHGPGAWERNEYCWCISFKRIDKP